MKKFRYSLANVLRLRGTRKELAAARLAEAHGALRAEQLRLDGLHADIGAIGGRPLPAHPDAAWLAQRDRCLQGLRRRRAAQETRVARARLQVEARQRDFRQTAVDLRQLEIHRDHEHQRWQVDANREEQKILDEISGQRDARNRVA